MASWLKRGNGNRQAIVGDDPTTATMLEKLRETGAQSVAKGTNDLERAAISLQMGASQRVDSESRRSLLRAIFRVENAELRYRMANARVDRFKNSALASGLGAYEAEETRRAKEKATKEIDTSTAQVPPLVVDLAEVVLLVAEFAFYYGIFTLGLGKDAHWSEKLVMAVLAILVPVVGIMSARFFAGSVQHLRATREHGGGGNTVGALYVVAATIVLATTCYATIRLVEWRYLTEDAENFGQAKHPPGTVMAIVFVAFIVTDALIRALLFSPGKRTTIRRRWSARHARTLDWWFLRREAAALASWQKRWFAAKALIESLKNDADQQQLSATVVILMTRGELGGNSTKLLRNPSADVTSDGPARAARGTYVPHEQVAGTDGYLHLPHRLIVIAEDRLEKIRPPEDPEQEQRTHMDDLLQGPLESAGNGSRSVLNDVPRPHALSELQETGL